MCTRRAAHNDFAAEDEPVESRGTATRSGNRSDASSVSAGDEHGDALDPGAECLREAEASERRLRGERGMPATRAGAARLEKRRQEEAAVRGRSRQICWR